MADALQNDIAELLIGGRIWTGWTSVTVQRGIEQGAGTFELALTDHQLGNTETRIFSPGDACRVRLAGEIAITGNLDDAEPGFDAEKHEIAARGRDATGDLVDCSAVNRPSEWNEQTLDKIAADIAKPFGISVSADGDLGKAFTQFRLQEGETAWAAIERAARMRALLPIADGRGGLKLTTSAHAVRVPGRLDRSKILTGAGAYSNRDRYSEYTVKGQGLGTDDNTAADAAGPVGRAIDPGVKRYRPLVILAEEPGDDGAFQKRAEWEAAVRAARSRKIDITVQGWRHAGGRLWSPNQLIRVTDPWLSVDADLLVAATTHTQDEKGTRTKLTLMPPAAFTVWRTKEDAVGW